MNQRFQSAEIRGVSEQYADNELYKAVSSIGTQLESELKEFGLCAEECFVEVLELLSEIAEKGEDILSELDNLWLRKENEYRRFDRHVSDDEIRKAVGIVFGFTILAIDSSRHPFYRRKLSEQLTQIVANHQFADWASTFECIFSVPLTDGWFDAFIDEEPEEDNGRLPLPKVLNTDRAQTYFQKAIDKGYMKLKDGKVVWVGVYKKGNNSQLAYFCGKVYGYKHSINGNIGNTIPEKELTDYFGVKKILILINQAYNASNKQHWRTLIDELFSE